MVLMERFEFKKLVYDSKFTKCVDGMSFVNSQFQVGRPLPVKLLDQTFSKGQLWGRREEKLENYALFVQLPGWFPETEQWPQLKVWYRS